jgi:hypothetical protein
MVLIPVAAAAQAPPRLDITASVGATWVFRIEDEPIGTAISPGAGVEWRVLPRLGLGVELSRVTGFEPRVVSCAGLPTVTTCIGSARSGVLETTIMSTTGAWYFAAAPRVHPYVIGGFDVMWSHTVASITFVRNNEGTILERESHDRGTGITAGFGVRVLVGRHVVLKPEWRIYDGSLLGSANLSAMRTSVAMGYGW